MARRPPDIHKIWVQYTRLGTLVDEVQRLKEAGDLRAARKVLVKAEAAVKRLEALGAWWLTRRSGDTSKKGPARLALQLRGKLPKSLKSKKV